MMIDKDKVILCISDLHVNFTTSDGQVQAVKGVSSRVHAGECLGIVGESGSGKSQTYLAAMGLLARNASVVGSVDFQGENLVDLPLDALNRIRGDRIAMIFQDPLTSLTPHLQIGDQMREVLQVHQGLSDKDALARCVEWLDRVRIPEARYRLNQYPHELSGGMRQRVMIAMAMLCQPELLIADEPTTALDVTIQADILELMDELRRDHGTAIVLITHDMGVVARMCDRVQVMRHGQFVEEGDCESIFYNATHDYTIALLNAVPRIDQLDKTTARIASGVPGNPDRRVDPAVTGSEDSPASGIVADTGSHSVVDETIMPPATCVLTVRDLRVSFPVRTGWFSRTRELRAVDGIGFDLYAGETLGIVGESGSGKSTLARAILQLIPPTSGSVNWLGQDLASLAPEQLKQARRELQIVFQDPLASLNPSMTIGDSIMEPLKVFERGMSAPKRTRAVADMMKRTGLDYTLINRYPHELSGGQNQRVGIARAMILRPRLLVCDEAVSALDVSIQAQIIHLLKDLQAEFSLSLIFISHDLSVVWDISQRILVMYLGSVVELATRDDLFTDPQHPYTRQLVSAVPIPDPRLERSRERIRLKGELASPMEAGARLRFLPSRRNEGMKDYVPVLSERFPGHFVAEHDSLESLLREKQVAP